MTEHPVDYVFPDMTDPEAVADWLHGELSDLHSAACDYPDDMLVRPVAAQGVLERLSAYDVRLIAQALGRRIADGVVSSAESAASRCGECGGVLVPARPHGWRCSDCGTAHGPIETAEPCEHCDGEGWVWDEEEGGSFDCPCADDRSRHRQRFHAGAHSEPERWQDCARCISLYEVI